MSRTKFVILSLVFGFAFLFISNVLFGKEIRMFPTQSDSFFGTGSPIVWKNTAATILLPIKIVLIGPLLPYIEFLQQEPDTPPPFFVIGFVAYWMVLALGIHYIVSRLKHS